MSKFALVRFPDTEYATEEEVVAASFELDAAFLTQKNIEERGEDGTKTLVSVHELNQRLVEREIENETAEESVAPDKIEEGQEEA